MNIAMYENGRYYKAQIVEGHLKNYIGDNDEFAEFYDISTKIAFGVVLTEKILESLNIPNLGYIKTKQGVQVFDKTKEEYTEEELPVYVDVFGSVKKTKKWTLFKTPTEESVAASKVIYKKIESELYKLRRKKDVEYLRNIVEEGNGIAYINTRTDYIYDLFNILWEEGIKVLFSYEGRYVIGKVAQKPVLDLYVSKYIVPKVIGKGGEKIKQIAAEVKAKRINVKPIE